MRNRVRMPDMQPVVVERNVSVPPHDVWPYITDGTLWARWQGEACDIDPIPGGRFTMSMPDGATASGVVVDVVANQRLVLTWGWTDAPFVLQPGSTSVEFLLAPIVTGGTRITVTHSGIPEDLAPHHRDGWNVSLDALKRVAEAL